MANSLDKIKAIEARGLIVVVLSAMTFGLYPSTSKLAYAEGANSIFVIIATTFIRALFLILICLLQKRELLPKNEEWRSVIFAGFFQAASIFGIIASLVYLPAPVTITIVFTHTIMLFFLLAYRKETEINGITLLTTCSALLGISFVVDLWGTDSTLSSIGITIALIGAVATAIRLYLFGKQLEQGNPAVVGAQVFTVAFLCTLLLSIYESPVLPISAAGYGWVIVSGLALAIPTYGMFLGISLIGSFQFSLFLKIEPVFTAIFAALILGEILKPGQYFGMFLVIASLIAYQLHSARRNRAEANKLR